MNVADSELMLGVLGREGYERDRRAGRRRRHAGQHLRGPRQRRAAGDRAGGRAAAPQAVRQRARRGRAAWRSAWARRCSSEVPRVDLVVGPDAYRNLPELIGMARRGERVSDTEFRAWEHYEDVPAGARIGSHRVRHGTAGLRLSRAPSASFPMTRGPERSRRLADVVREVERLGGAGHHRGHAARADGQLVSRRRSRLRRPAPRGRRGGRDPAAALHQPVPDRFHRRGHRGDGRDAGGLRARAPAGAERLQRGAAADAAALHPRAAISRS